MQNFITQSLRKATGLDEGKKGASTIRPAHARQTDNSPLGHMTLNNKWSYSTLEYPYDIQTRTDLGHYMMFYINVPNETAYTTAGSRTGKKYGDAGNIYSVQPRQTDSADKINRRADQRFSQPSFDLKSVGMPDKVVGGGSTPKDGQPKTQGTAARELGLKDRTVRTSDAIVLYMPPAITASYSASYKENEMGAVGGAVIQQLGKMDELKDRMKGGGSNAMQQGTQDSAKLSTALGEGIGRKLSEITQQAAGVNVIETYDKVTNRAVNNFLEAMFTGVGFRKFSYTYRFTPRDEREATMVDKIIRTFKFHMLPEYNQQTAGRYFTTPSEFDIFYMYRGDENTWMNKIYTCVCTGVDINYTPNQFQTLRPVPNRGGAPMAEMEMKLDFMETKLVTKEDILEGY
tara:strand:+ start:20 stop:1225 length:1206 start_codon:yes stop_codon:yes gene_type:complete